MEREICPYFSEFRRKSTWHPRRHHVLIAKLFLKIWTPLGERREERSGNCVVLPNRFTFLRLRNRRQYRRGAKTIVFAPSVEGPPSLPLDGSRLLLALPLLASP